MSLDQAMKMIQDILNEERRKGSAIRGLEDMRTRRRQYVTLRNRLQYLEQQIEQVKTQIHDLPRLPALGEVEWAQAVQALANLVFLELDTTGVNEQAEIIRVCVLDREGVLRLDQYAKPTQPITASISSMTGITNEQLQNEARPLGDVLSELRKSLSGNYVLSYGLEFDATRLREATRRANQPDIAMVGDDLMKHAMTYFNQSQFLKLEDLCRRIGKPLPEQPQQTIQDRAQGQLALLNAMAQGITGPATA